MIRTLVIIAVASFVLALACFAGAAAIGGRDLAANGWVWPEKWRDYGIHVSSAPDGVDTVGQTRDLTWSGGDTLQIDFESDVHYTQGAEAEVRIHGPEALIKHIVLEDGRLSLTKEGEALGLAPGDDVRVEIVAPSVRTFVVNGSGDLRFEGYDQENLTVQVNGSGKVRGEGRADRLAVTVSGSGEADLGSVQVSDANIKVVGSGETTVAPTGAAKVEIAGSGDVRLATKPAALESQIDGSGELHTSN